MAPKALSGLLARLRPKGPAAGEPGEVLACDYLRKKGYEIVARNFRCRSGEVDVIAKDGDATVFVEVKDRASTSHGSGAEAVTFGKRRRVIRAAQLYSASHGLFDALQRFDVISIDREGGGTPQLRHDRDAFDVDGD
jgi:putative endonuclease